MFPLCLPAVALRRQLEADLQAAQSGLRCVRGFLVSFIPALLVRYTVLSVHCTALKHICPDILGKGATKFLIVGA